MNIRSLLTVLLFTCAANADYHLMLKRSYVSGRNRVCVYNDRGSDYLITLPMPQRCERVIEKDDC